MKSPYRKGIQVTVSNAAVQAAATVLAQVYRAGNPQMAMRVMNLASEFVDEIEIRSDAALRNMPREGIGEDQFAE